MNWKTFTQQKPTEAGIYRWRLESRFLPGMFITFLAHMRLRGAGASTVLSPTFDHWDGYQVLIPLETQWAEVENPDRVELGRIGEIEIEGLTHAPCPYCKKVPSLHACQSAYAGGGGGVVIAADPHRYNTFWLECCDFGKTPSYADPRSLAKIRNEALGSIPQTT